MNKDNLSNIIRVFSKIVSIISIGLATLTILSYALLLSAFIWQDSILGYLFDSIYVYWLISVIAFPILGLLLCLCGFIATSVLKKKGIIQSRKLLRVGTIFNSISILIIIAISVWIFLDLISHSHCDEINDWFVLNHSIDSVEKRYGEFDHIKINDDGSGVAEYSGVLIDSWDNHEGTYIMEFNQNRIIIKVYAEEDI